MKQFITFLAVLMVLTVSVSAVDVGFGAGYTVLMQPGQIAKTAYSFRMDVPVLTLTNGTKLTSIDSLGISWVKETYPTMNIVTSFDVLYSGVFNKTNGTREFQAELSTVRVQKTLGWWTSYVSAGIAGLHISQTNTPEVLQSGIYDGYCIGLGLEPVSSVKVDVSGYLFPLYDTADLFGLQARAYYSF